MKLKCSSWVYFLSLILALVGVAVLCWVKNPIEAPLLIIASFLMLTYDLKRKKSYKIQAKIATFFAISFGFIAWMILNYGMFVQELIGREASFLCLTIGLCSVISLLSWSKK